MILFIYRRTDQRKEIKQNMRKKVKRNSQSGRGYQSAFGQYQAPGTHSPYSSSPSTFGSPQPGSYKQKPRTTESLHIVLLVMTLIGGLVLQIISSLIYNGAVSSMPRSLLIGIMFLILSVGLTLLVSINKTAISNKLEFLGLPPFAAAGALIVVIFLAATLFQFLYGLGISKAYTEPTSYVFLIDNSGSMEDSDPDQVRYDAVDEIMKDKDEDFPYMIYTFSDSLELVRDMAPKSKGHGDFRKEPFGGTSIRTSLDGIIDQYNDKKWEGGDHPRVVMLTDGFATDIGMFSNIGKVLKKYNKEGISISTVGLGYVDENLMKQIANDTGGAFIQVDDVSLLADAMKTAAVTHTDRDLLSARPHGRLNALYGILRIIFLTLLGFLVGLLATVVYGDEDSVRLSLLTTVVTAVLGSLFMELGTELLGLSSTWMWVVMWVLFALTAVLKHTATTFKNAGKIKR